MIRAACGVIAVALGGCSFGVSGLGWYTPDTPHNRLYSGYEDLGCEHPVPPIADAMIGGVLAVTAAVITKDRFDDDPLGPAVILSLPSALFFGSAAFGFYKMHRCHALQRASDTEQGTPAPPPAKSNP